MQLKSATKSFMLTLLVDVIAGATPPFGTWKLNLEKSR